MTERNHDVSARFRAKPIAISSPVASHFQQFEEHSERVLDVVRRESLSAVENLSPDSREGLQLAVLDTMKSSLQLLKDSAPPETHVRGMATSEGRKRREALREAIKPRGMQTSEARKRTESITKRFQLTQGQAQEIHPDASKRPVLEVVK